MIRNRSRLSYQGAISGSCIDVLEQTHEISFDRVKSITFVKGTWCDFPSTSSHTEMKLEAGQPFFTSCGAKCVTSTCMLCARRPADMRMWIDNGIGVFYIHDQGYVSRVRRARLVVRWYSFALHRGAHWVLRFRQLKMGNYFGLRDGW